MRNLIITITLLLFTTSLSSQNSIPELEHLLDVPIGGENTEYLDITPSGSYLAQPSTTGNVILWEIIDDSSKLQLNSKSSWEIEEFIIKQGRIRSDSVASKGEYIDMSEFGYVVCDVNAIAGEYDLSFWIRTPDKDDPRQMGLFVNGEKVDVLKSVSTSWEPTVKNVTLVDGANLIEIRDSEGVIHGDELDIDKMEVKLLEEHENVKTKAEVKEEGRFTHAHEGFDNMEPLYIPGSKYRLHQIDRPQPARVIPPKSPQIVEPPSDADVIFDGNSMDKFEENPLWTVKNGILVAGKKFLTTKKSYGDCQLHLEWRTPNPPQVHWNLGILGNSGVVLMSFYEVQVYDSYTAKIYPDGSAASIYGQTPPLVNACKGPGEWQSYDIIFKAPVFKDGVLYQPAQVTVLQNGVLVQNNTEILGPTAHKKIEKYKPHADKRPLSFKGENVPVEYRNIWIRELPFEMK